MEPQKIKTNNENLLFIGAEHDIYFNEDNIEDCVNSEEYYLDLSGPGLGGWSFMGLRPVTEEYAKELQRDKEPEDLGMNIQGMEQYFDYDKFMDDMEADWYESFDVQAKREVNGKTIYLGFGSGQDIWHYFEENGIKTYEDFVNHFSTIGLNKKEFDLIMSRDIEAIEKYFNK